MPGQKIGVHNGTSNLLAKACVSFFRGCLQNKRAKRTIDPPGQRGRAERTGDVPQEATVLDLFSQRGRAKRMGDVRLLVLVGVFLCFSACVMTRAEGEGLAIKLRSVEGEMAKLQRVRHEMEVLLSGNMKELVDRVARLEGQLKTMRESLVEGTEKSSQLLSELETLRGQLEEAEHRYQTLENDQKSLMQSHLALKQAQRRVAVPPLKKDHFEMAKKLYANNKLDDAIHLFEEFVKIYGEDKDLAGRSYYHIGESYRKLAEGEKEAAAVEKLYKKSVVAYQKIIEMNHTPAMREEALFKVGIVLKALGNKEAALATFNELLTNHKNSKRVNEAKKLVAGLKAQS